MSNENPNNTPQWRSKLDELEHFPGTAFNSDVAWNKLYGRLRGKKKSKKILWYWIAAACLLFGMVITLLNYHKSTTEPVNKEIVIKQQEPNEIKKPALKVAEVDKNKHEKESETELEKNKIVSTSNKSIQKSHHIVPAEVVTKIQLNDAVNYPAQEPVAKSLQILNNNSTITIILPKKKLNVVHINELGDPVIESSDVTRIEDIHSFKLKFGNGEVLSNSPVVSKPSGFIILKTKTASN